MEETNYVRQNIEDATVANVRVSSSSHSSHSGDPEKTTPAPDQPVSTTETGVVYTKKSYVQKLSLLGPKQKQNTMLRRLWQTLYYLSWPVIFYAG